MSTMPTDELGAALARAYPELEMVRAAAAAPVYLVGGAVRDLLLGRERGDIDLVTIGDAAALAARLGGDALEHERFATVKLSLDGHELDIATARAERYRRPGALPAVEPAADVETDLARRDFTINAMAVPLLGEPRLIDPYGGREDLAAGTIRVLHAGSFVDDPTRAIRAARYAARFGFEPDAETVRWVAMTRLETVSADRRRAELLRLAAEPAAARGFELLETWGIVHLRAGGAQLAARAAELLSAPPWQGAAPRARAVLAAALGPPGGEAELAAARPARPSEGVELAGRAGPVELVLARALGAEWLDGYLTEWRPMRLEIDGADLIAAGVPEGPAVGRGLAAARRRKLDGELSGRDAELAAALEAAREAEG